MKAYAVGRRAVARDYLDLAYMLDRGLIGLDDLIQQGKGAFTIAGEPRFSERLFLQQLVYTDDLEDAGDTVARLDDAGWDFARVKAVLQREVEAYVRKSLDAGRREQSHDAPRSHRTPVPQLQGRSDRPACGRRLDHPDHAARRGLGRPPLALRAVRLGSDRRGGPPRPRSATDPAAFGGQLLEHRVLGHPLPRPSLRDLWRPTRTIPQG